MSDSPVFLFDDDRPEIQAAHHRARATFKYFWRELTWENRRIVKGLDMAAVKAPFSDGDEKKADGHPSVEHMWVSEVDFDGRTIRGTLVNEPNWVTSVGAGDDVEFPLEKLSDWMYVMLGRVYGGFTVNVLRSAMNRRERQEHDEAWGLDFGDPDQVLVTPIPEGPKPGLLTRWFGGKKSPLSAEPPEEHPMSENMGPKLREMLQANPEAVTATDERGWTMLHEMALAGSFAAVSILLEAGADPRAVTHHGMTARQLAHTLGWERVVSLLLTKGG